MNVDKMCLIIVGLWPMLFSMEKTDCQQPADFFNRETATPEERVLFDKFVALRLARLRSEQLHVNKQSSREPGAAVEKKEPSPKERQKSAIEEVGSYAQSTAQGLYSTAKTMMSVGKVALWCIKGVGFAADVVDKVCTGAQRAYGATADYLVPVEHSAVSGGEQPMMVPPVNGGAVPFGYPCPCPTNINLSPQICMPGLSTPTQPGVSDQLMGAYAGGNASQLEQLVRMNQLFGSFQAAYEKNVYAEQFSNGGHQHSVYQESVRSMIRR